MSHFDVVHQCAGCDEPVPYGGVGRPPKWCPDCKDKAGLTDEQRKRRAAYMREYRKRHPEKVNDYARRWRDNNRELALEGQRRRGVRRRFGIEVEEYDAILAEGCRICGGHEEMCLDHDHDSGEIRGGLCRACNTALGLFKDDPERLRVAAAYLEAAVEAVPASQS